MLLSCKQALTHSFMPADDANALAIVNVKLEPEANCYHLWLLLCLECCTALIQACQRSAALLLLPLSPAKLARGPRLRVGICIIASPWSSIRPGHQQCSPSRLRSTLVHMSCAKSRYQQAMQQQKWRSAAIDTR